MAAAAGAGAAHTAPAPRVGIPTAAGVELNGMGGPGFGALEGEPVVVQGRAEPPPAGVARRDPTPAAAGFPSSNQAGATDVRSQATMEPPGAWWPGSGGAAATGPTWGGVGRQAEVRGPATQQLDGRLQWGGAVLSAPRTDAQGQEYRELVVMPPLKSLRAQPGGVGGNEARWAEQAVRLAVEANRDQLERARPHYEGPTHTLPVAEAIVGAVLLTLGASAALTHIVNSVGRVLRAAAQPIVARLKTALGTPMGDAFAERVKKLLLDALGDQLRDIEQYAAEYDADLFTVSTKVAAFLGGRKLADLARGALAPEQRDLTAEQRQWLCGAGPNLRESTIMEARMSLAMWQQGFGPQLGCLLRLGERIEAAEALLAKTHMAAAYHAAGGGGSSGARGAREPRGGGAGGRSDGAGYNPAPRGAAGAGGDGGGGGAGAEAARQPAWRPALAAVQAELVKRQLPKTLCPDDRVLFRAAKTGLDPPSCVNHSLLGKRCTMPGCRFAHETLAEAAGRIVDHLAAAAGERRPQAGPR